MLEGGRECRDGWRLVYRGGGVGWMEVQMVEGE